MDQTCKHCHQDLGPYKGRGHPREICKKCRNKRAAVYAKEYKRGYQQGTRLEGRKLIQEYKNKPCVDCGTQLPSACMDLDHVRGTKAFNFGHLHKIAGAGPKYLQLIADELAKCEVRCANCHRLRHHNLRR